MAKKVNQEEIRAVLEAAVAQRSSQYQAISRQSGGALMTPRHGGMLHFFLLQFLLP